MNNAMNKVKDLKEIGNLEEIVLRKTEPHVYFLTKNDEVVYVGQSSNKIGNRILDHARQNKKEFDSAYALRVENREQLNIIEGFFINKFSPLYNKNLPCSAEVCAYDDLEHVLDDLVHGKLQPKQAKIENVKRKVMDYVEEHPLGLPDWKKKYYEWKRAKDERWVTVSELLPDGDHKVKIHSIEPFEPPDTWIVSGDMVQVFFLGGQHGNQSATYLFKIPDNCIVGKNTKLGKLAKAAFKEDQVIKPFDYYNDLLGKEVMISVETGYSNSHVSFSKVIRVWAVGPYGEAQLTKTQKIKALINRAKRKPSDSLRKKKKIDLDRVRANV